MLMPEGKRPICLRCQRPQRTCLCQWITPTANVVELLILQHPLEVYQAKGSARLLQLSLQRCHCQVGEVFDQAELQGWLDAPLASHVDEAGPDRVVNLLLYPEDASPPSGDQEHGLQPAPAMAAPSPAATRLIVLDGTWGKSRKMLALNPALHHLPRLALQADGPSRYLIRKAHKPNQLSTLEASCMALAQLEGQGASGAAASARYAPLLTAFDRFIAASAAHLPGTPRL
jgi:DTW domain-containing protein